MDWPVLIIALIPVAVWILATIFRGVEEAKAKNNPRPQGQAPRRPASELDRFLEEARRRREPEKRREPEPMPVAFESVSAPPVAQAIPVPMPAPKRKEEPKPRPRIKDRPMPVSAPAPMPVPMELEPPPPPVRIPVTRPSAPMSPLVKKLESMMRDKDSLALAFVLREVFDRPKSQRR